MALVVDGGLQFLAAQMLRQLRIDDAAGVNRESAHTVGLAEPVEFAGKQHIGRLGLAVGEPAVVGPAS